MRDAGAVGLAPLPLDAAGFSAAGRSFDRSAARPATVFFPLDTAGLAAAGLTLFAAAARTGLERATRVGLDPFAWIGAAGSGVTAGLAGARFFAGA